MGENDTFIYSGSLEMDRTFQKIALSMHITFEDNFAPEALGTILTAFFCVGQEGAPFVCSRITHNVATTKTDFFYIRDGQTAPSLRFSLHIIENKAYGLVFSATRGRLGSVNLDCSEANPTEKRVPFLGKWQGSFQNAVKVHDVQLLLAKGAGITSTPLTDELGFCIAKQGLLTVGKWEFPLTSVILNYLTQTVTCLHEGTATEGQVLLEGVVNEDNSITGVLSSSRLGEIGRGRLFVA